MNTQTMNTQATLTIPTSPFDDIIARLKLLQFTDTPNKPLISDNVAICLQHLETLQASTEKRLGVLLTINASENLHWITRAIISAISNEHKKLSIQIERLLAILDDYTQIELCQDPIAQKNAFAQIKQLNELAMSILGLEQQVVPALLEICQNQPVPTHSNSYQTLH